MSDIRPSAILLGAFIQVLKPGVEDVLTTDMSFIYIVSRYLEFLQPELARLSMTGETRLSVRPSASLARCPKNVRASTRC
jgi:aarF domain-containing kinase